ncbi:MAG: hypothetical protein R3F43_01020 [bacterium]
MRPPPSTTRARSAATEDRGAVRGGRVRGAHPVGPGGQRPGHGCEHKYHPRQVASALAPYIQGGMKFFVAKVDVKGRSRRTPHSDVSALSPARH